MRQALQASGALSKCKAVELGLLTCVRLQQHGAIRCLPGQLRWEVALAARRPGGSLPLPLPLPRVKS
ncbi:MAG: hypothetical protein ACK46L_04940 [Synechococcaceae cyanobacterium]